MTKPGPTETRVRAALLRLWEKHVAEHWTDQESSWPATKVLYEDRLENGQSGQSIEAIQRVGRNVAKGKGFNPIGKTGWSELDDGLSYTYERGVFRVRRRESTKTDAAGIERGLSEGCRFALAAASRGYVDADSGSGHTNNALRKRGLIGDDDPAWLLSHWGRPLTPLGNEVAALAKVSARPGGGNHPRGPGKWRPAGERAGDRATEPETEPETDAPESDDPGIKNRNPLDTPDERDATIQVTWTLGRPTALVTVRAKDQDLTAPQLRSFAAALLEAAADIESAKLRKGAKR